MQFTTSFIATIAGIASFTSASAFSRRWNDESSLDSFDARGLETALDLNLENQFQRRQWAAQAAGHHLNVLQARESYLHARSLLADAKDVYYTHMQKRAKGSGKDKVNKFTNFMDKSSTAMDSTSNALTSAQNLAGTGSSTGP